jgi:hypothetical protein
LLAGPAGNSRNPSQPVRRLRNRVRTGSREPGPGWSSTTVSKVKPPSNFLAHNSLGSFIMDTTAVCPMVDNTTAGTATCKNSGPSTDAVASGALPSSPLAMQAVLDYASTTPAFTGTSASSIWYAGNRTKQEVLKNVFDQFNNQLAFGG